MLSIPRKKLTAHKNTYKEINNQKHVIQEKK